MNNQWLARFPRGTDMGTEALALPIQIALEAVIIETGFADGHDPGMIRKPDQRFRIRIPSILRIGMDADGRIEVGITSGQCQHVGKTLECHARDQCPADTIGLHRGQQFVLPTRKIRKIEMTVGIDQKGIHAVAGRRARKKWLAILSRKSN
jgi:hypothetical protein